MSNNIFVTLETTIAEVFYNSTSIETITLLKIAVTMQECKKNLNILNLKVWPNVKQPYFLELQHLQSFQLAQSFS